jgi:hypothetical protein
MWSMDFSSLFIPPSRNMDLGFTQLVTQICSKKLPGGGKTRPVGEDDNLIAICELIVYKMRDSRRTDDCTARYRDRLRVLCICNM